MRVVIAGGRDFAPTMQDYQLLDRLDLKYRITEVVSGKAKGADTFGEMWANSKGIFIKEFPADWSLGKKAGCVRNREMAQYCDAVILFPGGKGTTNMRYQANFYEKEILYDGVENESI